MAIGRGKKLKAYKYPLTFPKWWPSLALPWFSFHSYSYPHRLFHPMPCTSSSLSHTCTTIHRFLISPSVPASLGTCFPLSFSTQSWWKQPKFIHHPKTPTHNLTPPYLQKLLSPSFPLYLNPIPIYPILYTFLWKPTNQSSGGIVDDMAIHSPHNSPFTDLNTI